MTILCSARESLSASRQNQGRDSEGSLKERGVEVISANENLDKHEQHPERNRDKAVLWIEWELVSCAFKSTR